ncbi:MAG: nitroreductase family protein [Bacteroidetes bacterium]|nr:nitroreductase family protein [Bacteroidota bacterium]
MDFVSFVASRYSVRSYDPARPVDEPTLQRILEAGRMAPSAANRQPWKMVVVCSKALLTQLHRAYKAPWFAQAPVVLVVKGSRHEAWVRQYDGWNSLETDLAILMDHLVLAAQAEGLATCWISAFDPAVLSGVLRIQQGEEVFAITPLGYPVAGEIATRPKQRKPLEEVVEWL